jgi:C-terminal processing protease CtpA/Prc
MPTVVLIDGLSASSSEIFALALKEKQGATIV